MNRARVDVVASHNGKMHKNMMLLRNHPLFRFFFVFLRVRNLCVNTRLNPKRLHKWVLCTFWANNVQLLQLMPSQNLIWLPHFQCGSEFLWHITRDASQWVFYDIWCAFSSLQNTELWALVVSTNQWFDWAKKKKLQVTQSVSFEFNGIREKMPKSLNLFPPWAIRFGIVLRIDTHIGN